MTKIQILEKLNIMASHPKNIGTELLWLIEHIANNVVHVRGASMSANPFALEILNEISNATRRKRIRDQLRRLEQQKLLIIKTTGSKIIQGLSDKGELVSLKRKLKEPKPKLPNDEYCIVTFDISENIATTRKKLRNFLKMIGFNMHQQSVWISRSNYSLELAEYIEKIGASNFVTIFHGRIIK